MVFLDVVMETDSAGLELVDYIRKELKNETVRIVLRTGQPGQAPERRVIVDYDINDYKAKTELTADKLFTTLTAALRGYQQLQRLTETRRGLEIIIEAASTFFDFQSMQRLARGRSDPDRLAPQRRLRRHPRGAATAATAARVSRCSPAPAATGDIAGNALQRPRRRDAGAARRGLRAAAARVPATGAPSLYRAHRERARDRRPARGRQASSRDTDRELIELFTSRLSVAFDNVILYEQLQEANAHLEERVFQRTSELYKANQRLAAQRADLRRANEFKTEMLGTVAHDLKNPLGVILGPHRDPDGPPGRRPASRSSRCERRSATSGIRRSA